jgi:hypothetical protein
LVAIRPMSGAHGVSYLLFDRGKQAEPQARSVGSKELKCHRTYAVEASYEGDYPLQARTPPRGRTHPHSLAPSPTPKRLSCHPRSAWERGRRERERGAAPLSPVVPPFPPPEDRGVETALHSQQGKGSGMGGHRHQARHVKAGHVLQGIVALTNLRARSRQAGPCTWLRNSYVIRCRSGVPF